MLLELEGDEEVEEADETVAALDGLFKLLVRVIVDVVACPFWPFVVNGLLEEEEATEVELTAAVSRGADESKVIDELLLVLFVEF